jgi:Skp family chaperone for outer membrane proteins
MNSALTRKIALFLIISALVGSEVSDRFMLEFRFEAIEQKVEQNNQYMQKFQASLEDLSSSKSASLAALGKKVETLEASFTPLGQATKQQTDSVAQLHQEIASLQQAQAAEQEAEKNLSRSITEAEKEHAKSHATPVVSAPVTTTSASLPSEAPLPTIVAAKDKPGTAIVRPETVADQNAALHPDDKSEDLATPGLMAEKSGLVADKSQELTSTDFHSVRALPVVVTTQP